MANIHQGGKASLAFFPTALSGIPVSGAGVLELWRRAGATGLLLLLVRPEAATAAPKTLFFFLIVSDTVTGSTMLKFIWGRGQGPTAERVKLQKELFNFSKNVTYGFPSKPGDALADVNKDSTYLQNLSDI